MVFPSKHGTFMHLYGIFMILYEDIIGICHVGHQPFGNDKHSIIKMVICEDQQ